MTQQIKHVTIKIFFLMPLFICKRSSQLNYNVTDMNMTFTKKKKNTTCDANQFGSIPRILYFLLGDIGLQGFYMTLKGRAIKLYNSIYQ
jgi:hypothetical protein